MPIIESLAKRRSQYVLTKELPVSKETIIETVKRVTELVPDAFNCRSARAVILFGEKHETFWDRVYDVYNGKVSKEKLATFRAGAGTILFFYDEAVVKGLGETFPSYKENFPLWAREANGMLQISVWCALRDLEIGASLQHYNPPINTMVRDFLNLPDSYLLISQMPFGRIAGPAKEKAGEDINQRVLIFD